MVVIFRVHRMPRPSKRVERISQILQSSKKCIVDYGLHDCSLERIAQEAGLQRSLVRHFAGNRNDIITAVAKLIISEFDEQWDRFVSTLPDDKERIHALLSYLFYPMTTSHTQEDNLNHILFETFIIEARQDSQLQTLFADWFQQLCQKIVKELLHTYPNCTEDHSHAAAFGIISIYFNIESLTHLDDTSSHRIFGYNAAQCLLNGLSHKGTPS